MSEQSVIDPSREELVVNIEALAYGGAAVGTVVEPEELRGKKAFIPFAVPGETVTAVPVQSKKKLVNAELVSINEPSPHRIEARCPYFGQCGGCDLQHIELSHQRKLKVAMVEDLLTIHGRLKATDGVSVLAPDLPGFEYRRRMSFHINKKREFGLFRKHGRQMVEIDQCAISTPVINAFLAEHIELVKACAPEVATVTVEDHNGEVFLALEVHHKNQAGIASLLEKEAFKALERAVPNIQVDFRHKPVYHPRASADGTPPVGHFSQNNERANAEMLTYIESLVDTEEVTDLYAGAGNISIPLALRGHRVTAVEVDRHLVSFGRIKAARAGVEERVTFHEKSCEKWVEKHDPGATVVLDPPRGGALDVCRALDPAKTTRLVYVSCYPPTFTRDAEVLVHKGFELESVKVLDMFPQTYHSETIALFVAARG